jgi:hypothetical protein
VSKRPRNERIQLVGGSAANAAVCAVILFLVSLPQAEAQKFLGIKGDKKMTIKRLLPPAVNLMKKRIGVTSDAQGGVSHEIAAVLKTRVVTAIQRDPNFIIDDANAETRLSFKITAFRVESIQVQDTTTNPPKSCTVFVGRADVSYQAIEVKTGIPLDSENLSWSIESGKPAHSAQDSASKSIGSRIPFLHQSAANCGTHAKSSQSEANDELYAQLVQQVTQRAAPVDESIEVWIPGGKVKDLSSIALEKRWPVLLEKAEQTPKFEKPDEEANRVYLIALAHEALAYDDRREEFDIEKRRMTGVTGDNSREAEDREAKLFTSAKGHLEKAAQYYRDAIATDSKEKELKVPEGRVEYAVRLYATIERQRTEYAANRKKRDDTAHGRKEGEAIKVARLDRGATLPPPPGTAAPQPQAAGEGPNAEVLKLCQEKLDDATILDFIKNSPAHDFDLSVNGLVSLRKACGESTAKYVPAMRARMAPKSRPVPKPKPSPAPSK